VKGCGRCNGLIRRRPVPTNLVIPKGKKWCSYHNNGEGALLPEAFFTTVVSKDRNVCPDCARTYNRTRYRKQGGMSLRARWHGTKGSAKERGIPFNLTFTEYCDIVSRPCVYGTLSSTTSQSGIDRKDNNEGYSAANGVPCCDRHNLMKSDVFTYEEMLDIVQKYQSARNCGTRKIKSTEPEKTDDNRITQYSFAPTRGNRSQDSEPSTINPEYRIQDYPQSGGVTCEALA
jgi:hypothetical protein